MYGRHYNHGEFFFAILLSSLLTEQDIVEHALSERGAMDELANRRYPSEIEGLRTQIQRLGHAANEPPKTKADVDRVSSSLSEVKAHRSELAAELEELTRQHDDSKINLIRNQVAVYKKKASQQQTALDRSEQQLMKYESERKMLEAQLERIEVGVHAFRSRRRACALLNAKLILTSAFLSSLCFSVGPRSA